MRVLLQRVRSASVEVQLPNSDVSEVVGSIGPGLLALVAVGHSDGPAEAEQMVRKILHLRIFADEAGKMNRSLLDCGGALAVVSQFTLYGDTRKGRRPFFGSAAPPEQAEALLEALVQKARDAGVEVATGRFGTTMQVALINDGPVTLWLDSADWS